jgi:hypothetical protein
VVDKNGLQELSAGKVNKKSRQKKSTEGVGRNGRLERSAKRLAQ